MTLMRDEIFEQPVALERLIKSGRIAVREVARKVADFDPTFILIAARGSSDNAANYARYIFESYASLPVSLAAPSLFTLYRRQPVLKRAWVIAISESGESSDVIAVLREAGKQGALTLAVTNQPESTLAQAANLVMPLNVGPQQSSAATKSYTGQLTALALLAAEVSDENALRVSLERLPDTVNTALKVDEQIQELVNRPFFKSAQQALTLGRGYNFSTALEIALKLKETSYMFAAPYSSADFMQGPFGLAQQNLPAVLVGANGPAIPGLLQLADRLHEQKLEIVAIGDDEGLLKKATPNGAALPLDLKGVPEALSPIVCIVPGQLLSMHIALSRGIDPDTPRIMSPVGSTI